MHECADVWENSVWYCNANSVFYYILIGPAYSTERVHLDTYVKANGSLHDLIASYEFKVSFLADFVVWKQMFATSNKTNDIQFKIDEGDWMLWIPPQKASHALWTQYYHQV